MARQIVMVAACPFPYPRGTPVRIFRMSEALALRGHDVHVVTTHLGQPHGDLPFRVHRIPRVPTYTRTAAGPSYQKLLVVDPLLTARLLGVVRRVRPDVIHAHHYEGLAAGLMVRWLTGVPVVYDAHTLLGTELAYYKVGFSARFKRRIGALMDGWLPGRADGTIAVTAEIAEVLSRGRAGRSPLYVIGSGLEAEASFESSEPESHGYGRRLVYAGNFAAFQRTDLMLDGFQRVLARCPDVRLSVVASEPTQRFRAEIARRGLGPAVDVIETDFTELRSHLQRAVIALNPRTECSGLPQKLLNYLASGRAVVSFAGSAKNLEDGVNSVIVPDGDVEAFAEAILKLLDDPARARRIGEEGRRFAMAHYSWDRTAQQVEDVYTDLLGNGKPGHAG